MKIQSLTEALVLSEALSQYIENANDETEQTETEKTNIKYAQQLLDHADDIISNFNH